MLPVLTRLCLPVLMTFALSMPAQANELAESVVRESALGTVIEQYPGMMSRGIRKGIEDTGQVDPMVATMVGGLVSQTFDSRKIRQQVVNNLDEQMSDEALESVRQWYRSEQGREVTRMETRAVMPAAWNEIEQAGPGLIEQYEGSERQELFGRFDRASRATESSVDTTIAAQVAMLTALSVFEGERADVDRIQQRVEGQRNLLHGLVEQQVYATYLYTYQDLSESQLKEYVGFLESTEGRAFNRVITDSIQQAVLEPIDSLSRGLNRLMGSGN